MNETDDALSLDKPLRQRLARDGDGDPGPVRDIWHVLHEHNTRLKVIDKEQLEMRRAMNDIAVAVAVLTKTVEGTTAQFDAKLTQQFLLHEKRETEMQQRVMVRGLFLLLSGFGALAYFILSRVALATGAA